jgi:hypothetical protein
MLSKRQKFGDILMFSHTLLCHSSYTGLGSCMRLTHVLFRIDEGIQQGAVESSWFFAITCNRAFQNLNNKLTPFRGGIMAIVDNNYIIGPKEEIFEACKGFAADLTNLGLSSSWGYLHATFWKRFAPLNGTLSGLISQMGQSLMQMEMKPLDWHCAMSLLDPRHS